MRVLHEGEEKMNKVILMGRLTKDPEVRYSQAETPLAIARYSVAVRNRYSKNSENNTEFISIVAFGKQGEFVEKYFKKGDMISLSGRIHQDTWEDAEHVKHSRFEVIVEDQYFVGNKSRNADTEVRASESQIAIADEDLPY